MLIADDVDYPRAYGFEQNKAIWYIIPYAGATPLDVFDEYGGRFAHVIRTGWWSAGEASLLAAGCICRILTPAERQQLAAMPIMKERHDAPD